VRVRLGVVGCGLVAQVMHLPYLRELSDRFELVAVADLSLPRARACADRYGARAAYGSSDELLAEEELDALLVLTSGSHEPASLAALARGLHVFVEKPLALGVVEGSRMVHAADAAQRVAMVGYMKRYDPAYQQLRMLVAALRDIRLVRVTTLESPIPPYVAHYPLIDGPALPSGVRNELEAEDARRVATAIGAVDRVIAETYRSVLLDSLVHEINALRGILGEVTGTDYVNLSPERVVAHLRFGQVPVTITWVDLPGPGRYSQEFAFYTPDRRLVLEFPSPFLRSMPTVLTEEGGTPGTIDAYRTEHAQAFDEAFRRELIAFHEAIEEGTAPATTFADALRDIEVCEKLAAAAQARLADTPGGIGASR
jgi:predicted dehydrogenase